MQVSGGSGVSEILWNTGETTATIENLNAGIYSVTVVDGNGEVKSKSVEINGFFLPIYDENGNLISCGNIPCPSTLAVPFDIPSGIHHAHALLYSGGTVSDSDNVILKSGTNILLEAGFEVEAGGALEVDIEACEN